MSRRAAPRPMRPTTTPCAHCAADLPVGARGRLPTLCARCRRVEEDIQRVRDLGARLREDPPVSADVAEEYRRELFDIVGRFPRQLRRGAGGRFA